MHEPFFRRRPPLVRQSHFLSCWAAALVSWLNVTYPELDVDEPRIVAAFSAHLGEGERLLWPGLAVIAAHYRMDAEDLARPGALTAEYVIDRLQRGHLYLTYIPGASARVAAHTAVAWGVGPSTVELMDPFEGYVSRPVEFLASRTRAFVAWPSARRYVP